MPSTQKSKASREKDAQTSSPNVIERFMYSKCDDGLLWYVEPEDALALDLARLWKIARKWARKFPPSYKCPFCDSLELHEPYHDMMATCVINGKERQDIWCPNLLKFLRKKKALTAGTGGGSSN